MNYFTGIELCKICIMKYRHKRPHKVVTWSEFLEEELPNIDDHDEKRESAKDNHYLCSNRIKLHFKLRQIKSGVPDTVIPIRSTMPFRSIGSIGTVWKLLGHH